MGIFKEWFANRRNDHPTNWNPLFMLFAAEAYTNTNTLDEWIDLEGAVYSRHLSVNAKDAHADVYEWPFGTIVAFQGTNQLGQLIDYVTEPGFHDLPWSRSHVSSVALDYYSGIQDFMADHFPRGSRKPVTLIGHSLGGALAKLGGSHLASRGVNVDSVLTYGAPRFESRAFIGLHSFPCFCFEALADVVPLVPPLMWFKPGLALRLKLPTWAPRKYGKILTVHPPTIYSDCHTTGWTPPAQDWEIHEWEGGKAEEWWNGGEPFQLFGLPSLLWAFYSGTGVNVRFKYGARNGAGTFLTHQTPYYLWLTSLLSVVKYGQTPIGCYPGQPNMKKLHPSIFHVEGQPPTWSPPNNRVPVPGLTPQRRQLLEFIRRTRGHAAYEEFLRKDILSSRR